MPINYETNEITGLRDASVIYEGDPDEKIIELEVFKHFMVMIVEKHGQRQLKSLNLRTEKVSTHFFDSSDELCPINNNI